MEPGFKNALTVDVEDYFQVSAFEKYIPRSSWNDINCRVEHNTHRILDLFEENDARATFFILGWVAERYPRLVRAIYSAGHEVASHGYSHQLIYEQTQNVFRDETIRTKNILEDITGARIYGYRAASYSIIDKSRWALDILYESGFAYDSSIFPVRHDRYGMPDSPRFPYKLTTPNGNKLIEFPLSTIKIMGYTFPIAGGGYFRLYPYRFSRKGLGSINRREKQPFIFYMHPWEIDPDQPRVNASVLSKFRHYNNLHKCEGRLMRLLGDFEFSTVQTILGNLKL